jgi:hypothetical protein
LSFDILSFDILSFNILSFDILSFDKKRRPTHDFLASLMVDGSM